MISTLEDIAAAAGQPPPRRRRFRFHSVDLAARGAREWLSRGFRLDMPRLIPVCRVLGHRPVVDGTDGRYDHARWVACDRCGTRPEPQGALHPGIHDRGTRYTGLFDGELVGPPDLHMRRPGPWPISPRGTIGGQLVIGGRREPGVSLEVRVDGDGGEDTLAGHVALHPLLALYLHTEGHGEWLRRRLRARNDYTERAVALRLHDGQLWWELWDEPDHWRSTDPWWRRGNVTVDPRDLILGRRRYWHENVGEPQPAALRLAHGDDHDVLLQLQRRTFGREKAGRRTVSWCVDVHVMDRAISYRSDNDWKDGLVAWSVDVPDLAVEQGRWVEVACDLAAARVTEDRARYVYHHTTGVPAT